MTVPPAIAQGPGAETPEAVRPVRVGIGAGVLAGLYLFVLFMVRPVPGSVIALLGGPSDELGRVGGLELVWAPPPGADSAEIEGRFSTTADGATIARRGGDYVVRVPGVTSADAELIARRLGQGGGALRFHEVRIVKEMQRLASLLDLPMNGARPVDIEVDQWRADEAVETLTDYYLVADTREDIDAALAKAAAAGWQLPAGTQMAVGPVAATLHGAQGWRTYVLSERAELSGTDIADAYASLDPYTNAPIVLMDLRRSGADAFSDLTTRIVGRKLAIVVDGVVKSAPVINQPIHGGRASITMGAGDADVQQREADQLVATLRAAGLPAGGEVRSFRYLPPGDTTAKVWLSRLVITFGAGALVGLLAWAAIRALRPTRRRSPSQIGAGVPWRRLAVMLLAPATVVGLSYVPVFGVDYAELEEIAGPGMERVINANMLGLMPLVTAYVVVELLALVIPAWRRRRHAGREARRPLEHAVYALTFALVMLHGWMIIEYLEAITRSFGAGFDAAARTAIVATFAAATFVLAGVAHVIRRHGLGNGFAALIAAGWVVTAVRTWFVGDSPPDPGVIWRGGNLVENNDLLGLVTLVTMAVPLAVALRWRVRNTGEAAIRIPPSGIGPIGDGAGFGVLVVVLGMLPLSAATQMFNDLVLKVTANRELVYAIIVASTVVWSWAFAGKHVFAGRAERAGKSSPSAATLWRAAALAVMLFLFVVSAANITHLLAGSLQTQALTDPILVAIATAVLLDIVDDLRARRGSLEIAWSLQHVQHADLVADELDAAQIPHHLASSHARALLAFFGPFAPIDVLVPREHVTVARERIAKLLAP